MNNGGLTPSEVARLFEPLNGYTGDTNVRCYYCPLEGSTETTVLKDGQRVSRWVCVEHAINPPKTVGCYYCASEDAAETTVLKDGQRVSRWVCVEHAVNPPKRVGGVSARLRRFVHHGSNRS